MERNGMVGNVIGGGGGAGLMVVEVVEVVVGVMLWMVSYGTEWSVR